MNIYEIRLYRNWKNSIISNYIGICSSKISFTKILISARNKKIANQLQKKFKKVVITKDNQKIVDNCDWVFLSITPTVGERIIKDLNFRPTQTIISFISTITLSELKKAIKVKAKIVRAIPSTAHIFKKRTRSHLPT